MNREGFWCSAEDGQLPMPQPQPQDWTGKDTFLVALEHVETRMRKQSITNGAVLICKGFSQCRLCGVPNGNEEYHYEGWRWPEGLRHYVQEHNVRPSYSFERFIYAMSDPLSRAFPTKPGFYWMRSKTMHPDDDMIAWRISEVIVADSGNSLRFSYEQSWLDLDTKSKKYIEWALPCEPIAPPVNSTASYEKPGNNVEGFWFLEHTPLINFPAPVPYNDNWIRKHEFLVALDHLQEYVRNDRGSGHAEGAHTYRGAHHCGWCKHRELGYSTFSFRGWHWPSTMSHYIGSHNVRPSLAFEEFVWAQDKLRKEALGGCYDFPV